MKRIISAALAVILLIPQMSASVYVASADITTEQVCKISDSVAMTGESGDMPDIADEVYDENSESVDDSEIFGETDFFADIAEYGETVTPFNVTSGQLGDNVFFEFDETTGHINIYGTGDMWHSPPSIPHGIGIRTATIEYGVTSISTQLLSGHNTLENVYIPNSVTRFGGNIFAGTSLRTVNIPRSVSSMGAPPFGMVRSLTAIYVAPDNQRFISLNGVLYGRNQTILIQYPAGKETTHYIVPSTVRQISSQAFSGSSNLRSIELPSGLEIIGAWAFSSTGLTNITIPRSTRSIAMRAFSGVRSINAFYVDTDNQYFIGVDGVLFNRNQTVLLNFPPSDKLNREYYLIPKNVERIGELAFQNSGLRNVIIHAEISDIDRQTFDGATNLRRVVIPQNVVSIGNGTFSSTATLYFISNDISNMAIDGLNTPNRVIGWTPFNISETWNRVDIEVDAINPLEQMRFAPGNRNATFFRTGGGTAFSAGSMTLPIGVYTFYSRDVGGNETLQTFQVTMVDTLAPTISANWSGTWARSKFINVTAQDR